MSSEKLEELIQKKCQEQDREYITDRKKRLKLLFGYRFAGDCFNPSVFPEMRELYTFHYGEKLEYPKKGRLPGKVFDILRDIESTLIENFIDDAILNRRNIYVV